MSAIFDHLKVSSVKEAGPICFRSTDGTFLWIERMGVDTVEERKLVGRIFVSTFRNCVANPIHETPENVGTWKTKEGIGLGSTRQDVLKAYGKPSADTLIRGNLYRCLIVGDCQNGHPTLKPKPDIGDEVLKYTEADTLFETDFGLRNGIVIWVSISENP